MLISGGSISNSSYIQDRDFHENASTSLPDGERVRIPAIWVIEAYTPSMEASLRAGSVALGWNNQRFWLNDDFLETVRAMRNKPYGGGWLNLGYIDSDASDKSPLRNRKAALPQGVRAIRASIFQPLPSTTLFCACFLLSDDVACSLEDPLGRHFSSSEEPIDGGYTIHSVGDKKRCEVEVERAYLRSLCTGWVASNFPGYFSRKFKQNDMPTCELMLFSKHEDFSDLRYKTLPTYLSALGVASAGEIWNSDELKGLYLRFCDEASTARNAGILFGNTNLAFTGKDLSAYGKTKESQVVHWLECFDQTLGTWALEVLAKSFADELAEIRDEYGKQALDSTDEIPSELLKTDLRHVALLRDALPFAVDIKLHCKHESGFMHNVFEFQSRSSFRGERGKFFAGVRFRLKMYAKHIRQAEKHSRVIAEQIGRLMSVTSTENLARTNISLQRYVSWMTFAMLVLTVLMAIEPANIVLKWIQGLL